MRVSSRIVQLEKLTVNLIPVCSLSQEIGFDILLSSIRHWIVIYYSSSDHQKLINHFKGN